MSVTLTQPVLRSREFYVPRFALYLGNRPAGDALLHDVIQVCFKDGIETSATFDLTINNWDAEQRRLKHLDSPILNPKQPVRLHMGYLDDSTDHRLDSLPFVMQGTITELRANFPAAGKPTLNVTGQNLLHQFRNEKRSDVYRGDGAKASRIATRICENLNVEFANDTGHQFLETSYERRIQTDQFDIEFLLEVARADGYDIVVEERSGRTALLRFQRSQTTAPRAVELTYGSSLIEFQPTLDTTRQVTEVVVQGWDQNRGEAINVRVGVNDLPGTAGLDHKLLSGSSEEVGDRTEVVTNAPVQNAPAARAYAESLLARINQQAVTGTGSTVGIPELRAGAELLLWGLGRRYSGRYFVTGTTHTLGTSGYTTQFECRLEELIEPGRG